MIIPSDLGLSVLFLGMGEAIGPPKQSGSRASREHSTEWPSTGAPGSASPSNTGSSSADDEWLTVDDVCRIIKVGRRTFDRYLSHGTGPRVKRLDGGKGGIRIRREWLEAWMDDAA